MFVSGKKCKINSQVAKNARYVCKWQKLPDSKQENIKKTMAFYGLRTFMMYRVLLNIFQEDFRLHVTHKLIMLPP